MLNSSTLTAFQLLINLTQFQSQPDVFQGSQYGIFNTQSYFQCNGVGGNQANNFEVMLSTKTTIKNGLEAGKYYLIIKKMITTTNRNPPVITGDQISAATVPLPNGVALKMINKAGIVALGRVALSNEVVNDLEDSSTCLEVIVDHNDWDSQVHLTPTSNCNPSLTSSF
jgi:hypothetical protein